MKLKRFLLRYFPPGIILEYESNGEVKQKTIDLLDLTVDTDAEVLLNRIMRQEPLIPESKRMYVRKLLYKLIEKQDSQESQQFYLFKILRAHILPLTNCAFNKSGDRFITGSYDRTCKVWNTNTGEELLTLEGHKNVVYAIAFNNPYGDKVITGSFDKTCKVRSRRPRPMAASLKCYITQPLLLTIPFCLPVVHYHFGHTLLCCGPSQSRCHQKAARLENALTTARSFNTGVECSHGRALSHLAWPCDRNRLPVLQSSGHRDCHRVCLSAPTPATPT